MYDGRYEMAYHQYMWELQRSLKTGNSLKNLDYDQLGKFLQCIMAAPDEYLPAVLRVVRDGAPNPNNPPE